MHDAHRIIFQTKKMIPSKLIQNIKAKFVLQQENLQTGILKYV